MKEVSRSTPQIYPRLYFKNHSAHVLFFRIFIIGWRSFLSGIYFRTSKRHFHFLSRDILSVRRNLLRGRTSVWMYKLCSLKTRPEADPVAPSDYWSFFSSFFYTGYEPKLAHTSRPFSSISRLLYGLRSPCITVRRIYRNPRFASSRSSSSFVPFFRFLLTVSFFSRSLLVDDYPATKQWINNGSKTQFSMNFSRRDAVPNNISNVVYFSQSLASPKLYTDMKILMENQDRSILWHFEIFRPLPPKNGICCIDKIRSH